VIDKSRITFFFFPPLHSPKLFRQRAGLLFPPPPHPSLVTEKKGSFCPFFFFPLPLFFPPFLPPSCQLIFLDSPLSLFPLFSPRREKNFEKESCDCSIRSLFSFPSLASAQSVLSVLSPSSPRRDRGRVKNLPQFFSPFPLLYSWTKIPLPFPFFVLLKK